MKVLMTADTIGGVWTYAMELPRALSGAPDTRQPTPDNRRAPDKRHPTNDTQFLLATMGALPTPAQIAEVPPNVTLVPSEYRLEWKEEPWDDVARAGQWLIELERREGPDVVHLNGYTHGALPFRAPKVVVGHSCVMTWWRAVNGEDAPASWNAYREHVARGLRQCDLVVAPSAWMLGALDEHYP